MRGGSSSLPVARGGDGGDVSGGDSGVAVADGDERDEGAGRVERGSGFGDAEGESVAAAIVVGKRWVVMNESGRMLERRSGKVWLTGVFIFCVVGWGVVRARGSGRSRARARRRLPLSMAAPGGT